MKTSIFFAVCAVFIGGVAFANQATDGIHGPVTCASKSGNFSVEISANRKLLTILKAGEKLEKYALEQNVGDTETYYAPKSGTPALHFNDQGDFIEFNANQNGVDLVCPEGE